MATHTSITRRGFLGRSLAVGAAGLATAGLVARTARAARDNASQGWQVGIYTRPWDKHDWRIALDAIAEAGGPSIYSLTVWP